MLRKNEYTVADNQRVKPQTVKKVIITIPLNDFKPCGILERRLEKAAVFQQRESG